MGTSLGTYRSARTRYNYDVYEVKEEQRKHETEPKTPNTDRKSPPGSPSTVDKAAHAEDGVAQVWGAGRTDQGICCTRCQGTHSSLRTYFDLTLDPFPPRGRLYSGTRGYVSLRTWLLRKAMWVVGATPTRIRFAFRCRSAGGLTFTNI